MKLPNEKTFCVAPWFQVMNENDMRKRVCCAIESNDSKTIDYSPINFLNSESTKELKKQLHAGNKPNCCKTCWDKEKNNIKSLRQELIEVLTNSSKSIKNTWLESYFKNKKDNDWESNKVLLADITVGNSCNHACVMCTPEASSQIYKEWMENKDAFFIKEKLKQNPSYLEKVKSYTFKNNFYDKYYKEIISSNNNLKFLKIAGGEPFIHKNLLENLKNLPASVKKNLTIFLITNGSVDLLDTVKYIGEFKDIHLSISLEGIGIVQEYSRYGSKWNQLENNILKFRDYNQNIRIHHTLQTATILGLQDLLHWISKNDLFFSLGICKNPSYLSLKSLPNTIKNQILSNLDSVDIKLKQDFSSNIENISFKDVFYELKNTEFDINEYKKFIKYIEWYEANKKNLLKLKSIFPSLYDSK